MRHLYIVFLFFGLMVSIGNAQERKTGPIIKDYGKVWTIENPDFKTDVHSEFKAVFDIWKSPDSNSELNWSIDTAARYLNMHAQGGVPKSQIKAALVVHGKALKDLLQSEPYKTQYGISNPNHDLIKSLMDADVQVVICGQSAKSRGFSKEDFIPGCKIALSAMTGLIQLQNNNYQLIKF